MPHGAGCTGSLTKNTKFPASSSVAVPYHQARRCIITAIERLSTPPDDIVHLRLAWFFEVFVLILHFSYSSAVSRWPSVMVHTQKIFSNELFNHTKYSISEKLP